MTPAPSLSRAYRRDRRALIASRDRSPSPPAATPPVPSHRYRCQHGPVRLLRRHRRFGAKRPARAARGARAPWRRAHADRLRRGDAAPADQVGRAGGRRLRVHHALPRRPLAGAAGDAEVVRAARAHAAAERVRPARAERADGADALRVRAPSAIRAERRRARARRDRRARRVLDRGDSRSATKARPATGTRSSRTRVRGTSIRGSPSGSGSSPARTSAGCSAARRSTGSRPSRCSGRCVPGARS